MRPDSINCISRRGGNRLGHRGDAEYGVERHRVRPVNGAPAEGALIDNPRVVGYETHHAGHFAARDLIGQHAINSYAHIFHSPDPSARPRSP
jgi:hypothetical protein